MTSTSLSGESLLPAPSAKQSTVGGATRVCIGALGTLAAFAAVEHGVGEIVQGFRTRLAVSGEDSAG